MPNRMKSSIYINGYKLKVDYPQFNGGERNIRIPDGFVKTYSSKLYSNHGGEYPVARKDYSVAKIHALLFDSNAIMDLLLVCDAVRRMGVDNIRLTIPYLPAARQDRVMVKGEAFSLGVVADLINSIRASSVTIYDCHSDVGPALIHNCVNVSQEELISNCLLFDSNLKPKSSVLCPEEFIKYTHDSVIIAPDGGAMKKAFKVAKSAVNARLECAGKIRDVETGEIHGITFKPNESIDGENCLIADDISDAGGTFHYLSKHIKENHKPKNIGLLVTHGIFAKGAEYLYEYIDDIFVIDYSEPNKNKIIRL